MEDSFTISKKFGFLNYPYKMNCDFFEIKPLKCYSKIQQKFHKKLNIDGFYYPKNTSKYKLSFYPKILPAKIKNSERPPLLYEVPLSHEITLLNSIDINREGFIDTQLIINLLGFLFSTRLQIADWKLDGRIPISLNANFYSSDLTKSHFLFWVYQWWSILEKDQQLQFINIIYLHNRTISLEWWWEKFLYQYIIFDGLYKLHISITNSNQRISHRDRFKKMFDAYGLISNDELVNSLYKYRNKLFHEGLWDSSIIGYPIENQDSLYFGEHLARINSRLICSITNYQNNYIKSCWWCMGNSILDKMQN